MLKNFGLCWLIDEKLRQPTWLNRFEYVVTCFVYYKVWFFARPLWGIGFESVCDLLCYVFLLLCVKWRYLSVEKHKVVFVKLFPEISNVTRDNPPIASFIMRVVSSAHGNRKALTHPGNQNSDFCNFCYFNFSCG